MLNEDYKDMLLALSEEKAEFLLVGAYALAAHGYLRATMDIDIWVRPSFWNAKAVMRALQRFGAPVLYQNSNGPCSQGICNVQP